MKKVLGIFIAFVLLVLGDPSSIFAAALTSETVIPWSSDVSVSTKHTINFTTTTTIPVDGKVVITYPAGFDVSGVAFNAWSGFDGTRSIGVSGQVITITRLSDGTGSTAGAKYIVLSGIINNTTAASSYSVSVVTQNSGGTTLDGATTSSVFSVTVANDKADSGAWPMFMHDAQHTGRATNTTGALTLVYRSDGSIYHTGDNNIVLGSGGILITSGYDQTIGGFRTWHQVVDKTTGGIIRVLKESAGDFWHSGGALREDGVFYTHPNNNAAIWAYDTSTGLRLWNSPSASGGWIYSSQLVIDPLDGTVYLAYNNVMIAANSDGSTLKWIYTFPASVSLNSPTLSNDGQTVYLGGLDNNLYAIDRGGKLKWTYLVGDDIWNSAVSVATDGTVYVGSFDNKVYAINPDGTLKWSYTTANDVNSTPAIGADGTIFAGANGVLYAINPNGTLKWSYSTGGNTGACTNDTGCRGSHPVVSADAVHYQTSAGVFVISLNGTLLSRYIASANHYGDAAIDSNGWVFSANPGNLIYGYKPWTISASTNQTHYKVGDTITLTATSSMLRTDPSSSENNQVQVVMPNGDKVPLTYSSAASGNTMWTGTYTIPVGTTDGAYTATVQAGAYNVVTDITTTFASAPTGSTNTGITNTLSYTVDNTAPTGSVSIANGATFSTTPSVTLNLSATDTSSGVNRMLISQSSDFTGATWETYAVTKALTLSSGDGTKTVYVKFEDVAGNVSTVFSDTIVLDSTTPTGSVSIANGATFTVTPSVTLNLSATDASSGVNRMLISESSDFTGATWETYAITKALTLSSGDGTKTVYIKFEDVAGNVSTVFSDTIVLDSTAPVDEVRINAGAAYTTSKDITLTIAASDATAGLNRMLISENSSFTGATWETYAITKALTLSSGDGTKTVYIKFEDVAGNVSTVFSDTIVLDSVAPVGTIQIGGGVTHLKNHTANLSLTSTDATAGLNRMIISESSSFTGATWETYGISKVFTLSSGDGTKTVYVKYEDKAGKVSTVYLATVIVDTAVPTLVPTDLNTLNVDPKIFTYYYTTGKNLTISGTTEPSATVTITVNSDPIICTTTADSTGNFSCMFATTIPNGTHTVNITATDAAGNTTAYPSMTLGIAVGLATTGTPAVLSLLAVPFAAIGFVGIRKRR